MSSLTNEEKEAIKSNFKDINFVDKITGNNALHLLAMFKEVDEKTLNIYLHILKDKINVKNNDKKNPTVIAVQYSNIRFLNQVEVLIKEGLTVINMDEKIKENKTLFSYACSTSNYDVIIKVLEMGASFNKDDLGYIKNKDVFSDMTMIFLNGKYNDIRYKDINDSFLEFKIYNLDDFEIKGEIGSGSFGTAINVRNKLTGIECVLKKFKIENNDPNEEKIFLTDDSIKDIIFLRTLNRHNEAAAKIYGIIFSGVDYYIVMEKLDRTFIENLKLFKENSNNRDKYISFIKKILKECLICIDRNSDAGFIHCDLKGNNMMIDGKGKAKFIDYGFSSFLGISPASKLINHTIHTGSYVTRDGSRENVSREYIIDSYKVKIEKGYIGFNYDVASLGLMFIQCLFGYYRFISHNGKIYIGEKDVDVFYKNESITEGLIKNYGKEISDILTEMIEVNPNIRKSTKEFLNYPIFGATNKLIIPNLEITYIDNDESSEYIEMEDYIILNIINNFVLYNTVTQKNYKRCGFNNYDGIIETYKNDKFYLPKDNPNILLAKNFIIKNNIVDSLDCIFNAISVFNELNYKDIIPKDETEYFYTYFIQNIIRFYRLIYDDASHTPIKLFQNFYKKNKPTEFEKFTDENNKNMLTQEFLITLDNFYNLKPIMSFYGYIKFILQTVCTDPKSIVRDCHGMIYNLFKIIGGNSDLDVGIYNLFDIIKYCHHVIPDHIEIDMKPSFL